MEVGLEQFVMVKAQPPVSDSVVARRRDIRIFLACLHAAGDLTDHCSRLSEADAEDSYISAAAAAHVLFGSRSLSLSKLPYTLAINPFT